MENASAQRISLYYKDGRSDKVYTVILEAQGGGYIVRAEYGRRGGPQSHASKTFAPTSLEIAQKSFDSTVKEKTAKGYKSGDAAPETVFVAPAATASSPVVRKATAPVAEPVSRFIAPQLLNPVSEMELADLVGSDAWWAQIKWDGIRLQVIREAGSITGYARTGNVRHSLPRSVVSKLLSLDAEDFVMDGELVGNVFYAFDLLALNGIDLRPDSYRMRYNTLRCLLEGPASGSVFVVETAKTTEEKYDLMTKVRAQGLEGVVFKRQGAAHSSGRPNAGGDWRKFKFWNSGSFIVARHNKDGKSAVDLKLADGTEVGSCTIPPNHKMPAPGAIVEVQYLYFVGALVQPIYLGERDDIPASDCIAAQLKYKAEAAA